MRDELLTTSQAACRLGIHDRDLEALVLKHPEIPCTGQGGNRRWRWPALRKWRDRQLIDEGRTYAKQLMGRI